MTAATTILYFLTAANVFMIVCVVFILWVLLAPMKQQEPTTKTFTAWFGQHTHPRELRPHDLVQIIRRGGMTETALACEFNWRHAPRIDNKDIVRFRVVSKASSLRPGKWNESDGSET